MWLCRKKYLQLQAAILVLQRYYRGYKARKFTLELRQNNAVSNYFIISMLYKIFPLITQTIDCSLDDFMVAYCIPVTIYPLCSTGGYCKKANNLLCQSNYN